MGSSSVARPRKFGSNQRRHVLVVGYGRMGAFHVKTVTEAGDRAFTLDPNPMRLPDFRHWDQVPKMDAAIIACPISDLARQARVAHHRGLPLLIEKPGARTADQLDGLPETTAVGFVERANATVAGLFARLPMVGTFVRIEFERITPNAGPLDLDLAIHDVDLLRHYGMDPHDVWRREKNDELAMSCRLRKGIALLKAGRGMPVRRISIHGTDGVISADLLGDHGPDKLAAQYQAWRTGAPLATLKDARAALRLLETVPVELSEVA